MAFRRLLIVVTACLSACAPPPTAPVQDRLTVERMDTLVARPMAVVRAGYLRQGTILLEALIRQSPSKLERADLLQSYGVECFTEAQFESDAQLTQLALSYLLNAIDAYKQALGPEHPEVATALHSYADALSQTSSGAPPPAALQAFAEAYRIRARQLGKADGITLATTAAMADAIGSNADIKHDPAAYRKATRLLESVLHESTNITDERAATVRLESFQKLIELQLRMKAYQVAFETFVRLDREAPPFAIYHKWRTLRWIEGEELLVGLKQVGRTDLYAEVQHRLDRPLGIRDFVTNIRVEVDHVLRWISS